MFAFILSIRKISVKKFLYFLILCAVFSCSEKQVTTVKERKICIITLTNKQHEFMPHIKQKIENFYGCSVTILPHTNLPLNTYNTIRKMYYADSILKFLHQTKQDTYNHIIGVTDADIITTFYNGKQKVVFGLGYCPGTSNVISTNRLYIDSPTQDKVKERFANVAIHELGHNFGLKHCADTTCLMHDTEGKLINTEGNKVLCKNCKTFISKL